jgi:hypothetical protein
MRLSCAQPCRRAAELSCERRVWLMGSTSTTSGSGTIYTLTGGLILTGVAITLLLARCCSTSCIDGGRRLKQVCTNTLSLYRKWVKEERLDCFFLNTHSKHLLKGHWCGWVSIFAVPSSNAPAGDLCCCLSCSLQLHMRDPGVFFFSFLMLFLFQNVVFFPPKILGSFCCGSVNSTTLAIFWKKSPNIRYH